MRRPADAAMLEVLVGAFPTGAVLAFDAEHRLTQAGGEGLSWLGLDDPVTLGQPLLDAFGSPVAERLRALLDRSLAGESFTLERTYRGRNLQVRFHPVPEPHGGISGVLVLAVDVTREVADRARRQVAEARYQTLVESFPGACFLFDGDGRYAAAGGRTLGELGMDTTAMVGRRPSDVLSPEGGAIIEAYVARARAGERIEVDIPRPDGAVFTMRMERVADSDEVVATAVDVTADRRRAESDLARRDALLREVHHRVKNHLQVVSSLLGVTARRVGSSEAREALVDVRARVRSMAAVHAELHRYADPTPQRLDAFLQRLCSHLRRSLPGLAGVSVEVEVDEVLAPSSLATTLGLVVSELVSNAAEHAFVEGKGGRVSVIVASPDAEHVTLVVEDDGVGMEADAGADRLGLWLVRTLVTSRGGSVHTEDVPRGTRWAARIPLADDETVAPPDA